MFRARPRWASFAFVILVTTACAAVDIVQWLRDAPLWVDEEMIALNFRDRSFARLPGALWLGQSAPLGWLFAERAMLLAFGTRELVLRVVPLLFGIATLVAAAWMGLRWMNAISAAVLVVLLTFGEWTSHFTFEVKHYSADMFWALFLPALAAWALEAPRAWRRWLTWWALAAIGQFFANGALLIAPACAAVMVLVIGRRDGPRSGVRFVLCSVAWFAAFAAHYILTVQYTHHSQYLRSVWSGEVPPEGSTLKETLRWLAQRVEPIGVRPGGATLPLVLWAVASAGFLLSRTRVLGAMLLAVPISAFVFAALRLVPLHDRFALWIVPALYAGVALLLDAGLMAAVEGWRNRRWARGALGTVVLLAALLPAADVFTQGRRHIDIGVPGDSNHALDDRSAVKWLLDQRQPGDAIVTTKLGWPAVWWYGQIPLNRRAPGGRLSDGTGMYEISLEVPRPDCGRELSELAASHRRLLVYVGFPDHGQGFHELVLHELRRIGRVTAFREFAFLSRVAVVETGAPDIDGEVTKADDKPEIEGCLRIGIARRW
jgi:hypothetical protein